MSFDNSKYFEELALQQVASYIAKETYGHSGYIYHKPLEGSKWEIRPRSYNRYKLLKLITDMPEGKRKYILMHKRAYDLYKTQGPFLHDEARFKLLDLMKQLKTKINN